LLTKKWSCNPTLEFPRGLQSSILPVRSRKSLAKAVQTLQDSLTEIATLAKPFNQNADIARTIKRVRLSRETLKKTLGKRDRPIGKRGSKYKTKPNIAAARQTRSGI
jgi:hypothetical protein